MEEPQLCYEQLKLNNQLCFPLYACSRRIVNRYAPLFKPLGITYTQYIVFLVLWEEDGLSVGELCRRHGVLVFSDEIHCDFAFPEHPHTVFLQACPELADRTVLCTAPSKSFNLAGLQASNIWIPDPGIRERFSAAVSRTGYFSLNAMALEACRAAYTGGEAWLEDCRAYLRGNLDFLRDYLRERLPAIRLIEPDGTYFAWLDCRGLGLDHDALERLILEKAGLWLDGGAMFGPEGEGFQRMVLACTRATLREALERLEHAVNSL